MHGHYCMLVIATSHISVLLTSLSLSHTHTHTHTTHIHTHMRWRLKKRTIENTQADELLNLFGYSMPMPHRPCCGVVHYLDHAAYYK